MQSYDLKKHDAAEMIGRIAATLSWGGDYVPFDLAHVDNGNVNVYVDGLLVATLRGKD